MSDNLQRLQGSSARLQTQRRADRQASSCTECRRRKQKCSQGHPCTNCARRFPQPICDYGTRNKGKRTGSRASDGPAAEALSTKEGPYPHLNLAGIHDAILQLESTYEGRNQDVFREREELVGEDLGLVPSYAVSDEFTGHVRNWLPFRLTAVQDENGNTNRQSILEALKASLERENGSGTRLPAGDEWMLDAAQLIWAAQASSQQPTFSLQSMDHELRHLPMVPTRLNKELARTHLRLIARFKGSISGYPSPDHPLMKHWVPFLIQDPLLINVVLFTSACFLNETGHLPKTVVVALRGMVYQSLNHNLRSAKAQTSDAAILAVAEMVMDEWLWGRTQDLHAHMAGLRTMIWMRGGLQDLGMHGYISKIVLINDAGMALGHEAQPEIFGRPGFEFEDPIMVPFQVSLNSPLITGWPSFASCAASLKIHPCTAQILDDVRTMMQTVLALPPDATPEQLQHVASVASWVYGRIGELPDNVPLYQWPRPGASPADASSDTASPPNSVDSTRSLNGRSTSAASPESTGASRTASVVIKGEASSTPRIARRSPPADVPDPVYRMVRMAATIYCRAVLSRAPTSMVCSASEVLQVWGMTWRIPMNSRTTILGIYLWTLLAVAPSCHDMAPARFIKTFLVNGLLTAAVENWHVSIAAADAALRLQRWLRGSATTKRFVFGGETSIEKHGFAVKEVLGNISTVHKGHDDQGGEDENED